MSTGWRILYLLEQLETRSGLPFGLQDENNSVTDEAEKFRQNMGYWQQTSSEPHIGCVVNKQIRASDFKWSFPTPNYWLRGTAHSQ